MGTIARRLTLGLVLIAAASALLLVSDRTRRPSGDRLSQGAKVPLKKWRIRLANYVDAPAIESACAGFSAGLRESGLAEGRDYELRMVGAQGDAMTLDSILAAAVSDKVDLIAVSTTPALQGALQRTKHIPIVFTSVANPVIAGAGKSDTDHAANVTGVSTRSDFEGMADLLRELMPRAKRIGTLFVPAEVNSVIYKDSLCEAAKKRGMEVAAVPVATSSEMADAARALCGMQIDAVCQISDNVTGASFASIARAAQAARLPLFGFVSENARMGAAVVVARDFEQAGRDAAALAARIIRGENPQTMPFQPVSRTRILVNLPAARASKLAIPESLLHRADEVIRE